MESSIGTNILLPVALGVIMLGLGVSLTIADFTRVVRYPKALVVGLACLLFNLASLVIGYQVPRLVSLPDKQAIAIAMEIGIHNGTLAIYIAFNVLGVGTPPPPSTVSSCL